MGMKMKNIELGVITMSDYTPKSRLFMDYMFEEPKYAKEVKLNPSEVVLPADKTFVLVIDYPLTTSFKRKFETGKTGMTRRQLVNLAVDSYKKIYKTEDMGVGEATGNIPGMFNRATSDGRYGIWGHGLGDLVLCSAIIMGTEIHLGVDS